MGFLDAPFRSRPSRPHANFSKARPRRLGACWRRPQTHPLTIQRLRRHQTAVVFLSRRSALPHPLRSCLPTPGATKNSLSLPILTAHAGPRCFVNSHCFGRIDLLMTVDAGQRTKSRIPIVARWAAVGAADLDLGPWIGSLVRDFGSDGARIASRCIAADDLRGQALTDAARDWCST